MSKRLQVTVDDEELDAIATAARQRGLSVGEWVRLVLRMARDTQADAEVAKKLNAIRAAAAHDFPTSDIDEMLAQIERL